MRNSTVKSVEASEVLGPFVRRGVEGGCIACRLPISTHFSEKGNWIGCQALNLPEGIPFYLIPDRRILGRRVTPAPADGHDRRQLTDGTVIVGSTAVRQRPRRSESAGGPALEPATTAPRAGHGGRSQVAYVARLPITAKPIKGLPPAAQKIYLAIAKHGTGGATRKQLLSQFRAASHTGRVDGSVVRLRGLKLITVQPV